MALSDTSGQVTVPWAAKGWVLQLAWAESLNSAHERGFRR